MTAWRTALPTDLVKINTQVLTPVKFADTDWDSRPNYRATRSLVKYLTNFQLCRRIFVVCRIPIPTPESDRSRYKWFDWRWSFLPCCWPTFRFRYKTTTMCYTLVAYFRSAAKADGKGVKLASPPSGWLWKTSTRRVYCLDINWSCTGTIARSVYNGVY